MKDTIRAIWDLMAGERWRYGLAIGCLVVASCLLYLVPLVPQITIDGALSDKEPDSWIVKLGISLFGGKEFLRSNLWLVVIAVGGLTALSGYFTYLRTRFAALSAEQITLNLRDNLYARIQRLPCSYFDHRETGDLLQRCTSDVETTRIFLSVQVAEIGRAIIMLIIPIPLMIAIDLKMALASIVLIPLIVTFSTIYFFRIRKAFQEKDEAEGKMTARIQENLTGIRVVKAFHRQSEEESKFDEYNTIHRNLDYRLYELGARFWSASDLICFAQFVIVLVYGSILLTNSEISAGEFYFFISTVGMFIWPIRMMGRLLSELGKAIVAVGRIKEVLHAEPETIPESPTNPELTGGIKFDNVSFSHDDESPVLSKVTFTIDPGKTLAILGPSGSGKSTIVNLLLRFYDCDEGQIELDGTDIQNMSRQYVRSQIAVVMQEPFLYSRSLRENITIARKEVREETMLKASSIAALHESIERFDRGYDTVVGERGVTLSGGQRQRVALARALMQEPAILILDDALSAVDTETESEILEAFRKRKGKHTTIIIAHRLSTLMDADEILVIDEGMVKQIGTHETLKDQPGIYQKLWEIQTAGTEELV